jgi:hypothetical protein
VEISSTKGGIYLYNPTGGIIEYSNIYSNGMGIYNNSTEEVVFDCPNNYWGHETGPYHPELNPDGLGDSVNVYVNPIPFLTEPIDVGISDQHIKISTPSQLRLFQNYPNPFNPVTTIQFQLPQKSHITLNIYDISGKLVETLLDEKRDAGYHSITWNAERQASGVYFYRIVTDSGFEDVRKCVMLK